MKKIFCLSALSLLIAFLCSTPLFAAGLNGEIRQFDPTQIRCQNTRTGQTVTGVIFGEQFTCNGMIQATGDLIKVVFTGYYEGGTCSNYQDYCNPAPCMCHKAADLVGTTNAGYCVDIFFCNGQTLCAHDYDCPGNEVCYVGTGCGGNPGTCGTPKDQCTGTIYGIAVEGEGGATSADN